LDNLQEQIAKSMEGNEEKLSALKEMFSINLEQIQKMFENLQNRIEKLNLKQGLTF
jgi:UDP-glucose 6-dehydrogenase